MAWVFTAPRRRRREMAVAPAILGALGARATAPAPPAVGDRRRCAPPSLEDPTMQVQVIDAAPLHRVPAAGDCGTDAATTTMDFTATLADSAPMRIRIPGP